MQLGRQAALEETVEGASLSAADSIGSRPHAKAGEDMQHVSVEDDGASGVGTAAATALSVALAHSWAMAAQRVRVCSGGAPVSSTLAPLSV